MAAGLSPATLALPPAPAGKRARRGDPISSRQRDRGADGGRDVPRGGTRRRPARLRQRDAHPRVDPRSLGLGSCRALPPRHSLRDTGHAEGQGLDARGAGFARAGHRGQHRALQRRRRHALQDAAGDRPRRPRAPAVGWRERRGAECEVLRLHRGDGRLRVLLVPGLRGAARRQRDPRRDVRGDADDVPDPGRRRTGRDRDRPRRHRRLLPRARRSAGRRPGHRGGRRPAGGRAGGHDQPCVPRAPVRPGGGPRRHGHPRERRPYHHRGRAAARLRRHSPAGRDGARRAPAPRHPAAAGRRRPARGRDVLVAPDHGTSGAGGDAGPGAGQPRRGAPGRGPVGAGVVPRWPAGGGPRARAEPQPERRAAAARLFRPAGALRREPPVVGSSNHPSALSSASCCSSCAPTWPPCCYRGRCHVTEKWRSACRLALRAGV